MYWNKDPFNLYKILQLLQKMSNRYFWKIDKEYESLNNTKEYSRWKTIVNLRKR